MSTARFDRDDLIESRIERIMGDPELLKTEINEIDFFADSRVIDAIQSGDELELGRLIMSKLSNQVNDTAIQEIDEEAADRAEAQAVARYESRMEDAA